VSVEDKNVVITGAAGNLGGAAARAFAGAGANLALIDNRPDRLAGLFPDLKEKGGTLLIGNTDVTHPASVGKMVDLIMGQWERIDVLLNIAGGYRGGAPVHETSPEDWDFIMNLNAKSVFLVAGAVVPHMIEQGREERSHPADRVAGRRAERPQHQRQLHHPADARHPRQPRVDAERRLQQVGVPGAGRRGDAVPGLGRVERDPGGGDPGLWPRLRHDLN
jgi:NAD(P)-dependent dehydrogenase (short-subunit alcohol dehydrogenase family)